MSFFAIGDIHGCSIQLNQLLEKLAIESQQVVFMGDYVDVGPNSKDVIETLIQTKAMFPDSVFLLGNHEVEMKNFIETGDFSRYAQTGGLTTIRSYCGLVRGNVHKSFVDSIPTEHIRFLKELDLYFETDEYFFSHAGFDPQRKDVRTVESLVTSSYSLSSLEQGINSKTLICGHYFQARQIPLVLEKFIGVDTGCGVLNGPLTAVELPSLRIIQS